MKDYLEKAPSRDLCAEDFRIRVCLILPISENVRLSTRHFYLIEYEILKTGALVGFLDRKVEFGRLWRDSHFQ